MKKLLPWTSALILIVLAGCNLPAGGQPQQVPLSTPTLSPEQVQTQINQMLTQLPTSAGQPAGQATPTSPLPTLLVDTPTTAAEAGGIVTASAAPTATNTAPPEPTATPVPPTATTAPVATNTPAPAGTPVPGDPRTRLGAPTSTDPMDDPDAWVWPTGSDKFSSASFSGGKQYVTAMTGTDGWRLANPTGVAFSNLYLEATFRTETCSGSDRYGLMFRVPDLHDANQGYLFGFTCDGKYALRRWDGTVGTKGEMKYLVNWTSSSAIAAGSNQTNRMGIMMFGDRLLMYANGQLLGEARDSSFPSGYFGVFVGGERTVEIDEMSFWKNPAP